jgi:hypothetical protein
MRILPVAAVLVLPMAWARMRRSVDETVGAVENLQKELRKPVLSKLDEKTEADVGEEKAETKKKNKYSALYTEHAMGVPAVVSFSSHHHPAGEEASTEALLQVLQKMIKNHPEFRASLQVMLDDLRNDGPEVVEKELPVSMFRGVNLPPLEIMFQKINGLLRAMEMMRESLQKEMRKLMSYENAINLQKSDLGMEIEDYLKEMDYLNKKNKRTSDEVSRMEILNQFTRKYHRLERLLRILEELDRREKEMALFLRKEFPA